MKQRGFAIAPAVRHNLEQVDGSGRDCCSASSHSPDNKKGLGAARDRIR